MAIERSVKWHITAITVTAFIASTSVLVFLVSRESTTAAERDAVRYASTLTVEQAGLIDRQLDLALQTTTDLARVLETATAQHSMTRAQVTETVRAVLRDHPECVGSTAIWERTPSTARTPDT